jgi:hypothetical protein
MVYHGPKLCDVSVYHLTSQFGNSFSLAYLWFSITLRVLGNNMASYPCLRLGSNSASTSYEGLVKTRVYASKLIGLARLL